LQEPSDKTAHLREKRGTADSTIILSGGIEVVSAGGNDFGAQISAIV
jgi:hypothetical protein